MDKFQINLTDHKAQAVTEYIKFDEERNKLLSEIEQRKNDFIGMASHELKTPLTSVKIFTQILQKNFLNSKDEKTNRFLAKIDEQIDRLTHLVNDLLDVSKIEAGELHFHYGNFYFDQAVIEIVEDFRLNSGSHAMILKGSTGKFINGDRERIGQVLINILGNAIKYSPRSNKVLVHLFEDDSQVGVSVQDFGIGIQEEYKKNIFGRFFRVPIRGDPSFPGLGIGLYISAEIIRRHKGKIWFESSENRGSTFYFTIPVTQDEIKL